MTDFKSVTDKIMSVLRHSFKF